MGDEAHQQHRQAACEERQAIRIENVPDSVRTEGQPIKEWRQWCDAGPGPCTLNGVPLPASKEVFTHLVTPKKIDLYVAYLIKRPKKRTKKKGGTALAKKSIESYLNGLSALQTTQISMDPSRFTPEMKLCIWTPFVKQQLALIAHQQGEGDKGSTFDHTEE